MSVIGTIPLYFRVELTELKFNSSLTLRFFLSMAVFEMLDRI
jgi:hypothetical protein